jgi:hypothetical protein
MILIEHPETGERCLVDSLDGYAGWAVLAEAVQHPGHDYFRWDAASQTIVEDFAALDARLLAKIDRDAGAFRSRFITSIPGQETTYRLKEDEALAWEDGVSDPADFPYLREEAAAKGVTIAQLAAVVLGIAAQWRVLNPKIEAARTAAKDAVLAADTLAAKEAAATVNWEALL